MERIVVCRGQLQTVFVSIGQGSRLHAVTAVPDQPTVWITALAGRLPAIVLPHARRAFALLLQHLLASRQQRGTGRPVDGPVYSCHHPAGEGFAALTITSTSSVVISPRITSGLTAISPPVGISVWIRLLPILGHSPPAGARFIALSGDEKIKTGPVRSCFLVVPPIRRCR